jgi:hypothetical protein
LVRGNSVLPGNEAHRHAGRKRRLNTAHRLGSGPAPPPLDEVMISIRSEELVLRSVISHTLPKWETLSGQFGGNLKAHHPATQSSI